MGKIEDHLKFRIAANERLGHLGGANPIDKFILEHGKSFEIGPDTFNGPRGPQGECFASCARLAQAHNGFTYVEGYVQIFNIPISHAWLVDAAGNLIEPTLNSDDVERIGGYFGVEFSTGYLINSLFRNRCYGLLDHFYNAKTIVALVEGRADFKPRRKG
jgi:hypothetical protein